MLRRLSATPCPAGPPPGDASRRDSILSVNSDTTGNLDYTTEFKALFRDTKPRRRPAATTKPNGVAVGFTIHEDQELEIGSEREETQDFRASHALPRRRTSMSQPAQRSKHRVSFVPSPQIDTVDLPPPNAQSSFSNLAQSTSFQFNKSSMPRSMAEEHTLPHVPSPKIAKPARRGTIYIPTDDTTIPSMYMGIFSPLKSGHLEAAQEEASDMTGLAAQMARKKSSRKSILATSPKRAPLRASTRPLQAPASEELRPGQGPGKENLPPGHVATGQYPATKKNRKSILSNREPPRRLSMAQRPSSRLFDQTASSARATREQKPSKPPSRPSWNSAPKMLPPQALAARAETASQRASVPEHPEEKHPAPRVPTRFVVPGVKAETVQDHFPLLPEGIRDVSMYEESWLTQQEVAITQLVNSLFRAASPLFAEGHDDNLLRLKLLEHYGSPEMSLLYKRLQGALMYGALSVSGNAVPGGQRLCNDLGHRRTFIGLWLDTYDHHILRAALEVIVGRLVGVKESRGSDQSPPKSPSMLNRRVLRLAIETFLIRNEDSNPGSEAGDTESWSFQRTLLRSLMLIKLLDVAKRGKDLPSTSNLFQASSTYKSSGSVVQQLIRMLNPAVGDPIRPLNHLGYNVSHCQYPLEEYQYEIQNLAIDLRDGVRITRLVELLLYRSASHNLEHRHDPEATTTLIVPTGETLSLTEGQQDWPLSQHLKFPCLSRATKLFNTQIAISALDNLRGMNSLFRDINADDIVDGYREKTVRLLWALTSKWGLGGLVDWDDLRKEIKRLGRYQGKLGNWLDNDLEVDEEDPDYLQYKNILKQWVKAIAGAHGLVLRNFTTSFADGRIFEAIVDEYQPYLTESDSPDRKGSLASRLKSLGCSEQFVRLFEKSAGRGNEHIFDRDFVLASLAFLCSRLLGPSKRARAALAIQRGWRGHWDRVMEGRKSVLQALAASCAVRVQGSERKCQAKTLIWQTWKSYKAKKQEEELVKGMSIINLEDSSKEEDIWLSLAV